MRANVGSQRAAQSSEPGDAQRMDRRAVVRYFDLNVCGRIIALDRRGILQRYESRLAHADASGDRKTAALVSRMKFDRTRTFGVERNAQSFLAFVPSAGLARSE